MTPGRREHRSAGRHRRGRRRVVRRGPGPAAARCLRPGDRRPRAGARGLLLRLRHPLLDRRPGQRPRPADRPHARASSPPQDIVVRTDTRAEGIDLDAGDGRRGRRGAARLRLPRRRDRRPARPPDGAGPGRRRRARGAPAGRRRRHPGRDRRRGEAGRRPRRRLHRPGDGRGAADPRPRGDRRARRPAADGPARRRHGRAGLRGHVRHGHRRADRPAGARDRGGRRRRGAGGAHRRRQL